MTAPTVALEEVDGGSIRYVEALLAGNDLPSSDVGAKPECFYVAYDGDRRVGVGGLEPRGSDGLLRSLVVERSARGRGYGAAICAALEDRARTAGLERLYLLTTTASGFFDDRGYATIDRADAPDTIRETTEFADLCPDAATCMTKSL